MFKHAMLALAHPFLCHLNANPPNCSREIGLFSYRLPIQDMSWNTLWYIEAT